MSRLHAITKTLGKLNAVSVSKLTFLNTLTLKLNVGKSYCAHAQHLANLNILSYDNSSDSPLIAPSLLNKILKLRY